jgi:hypothetical protein
MKKKNKKYDPNFFSNAKKIVGEKRFHKAIQKGQDNANEIRLKMARELIGKNQSDLKGMTQPEVSKIEARKDLKISTLKKYAKALGMKLKISLESEEDENSPSISIYG